MRSANSMTPMAASSNPVDAYAQAVTMGTIPAGKYHRLACLRHLRDRSREGAPGFHYRFIWEARDVRGVLQPCAVRFLEFARKVKHYKGEWAGRFFEPSPNQVFRLGSIFGWRHAVTGLRRFTTAYNEIPRKNGKTFEAAIVAVYVTFFEGEPGAEGYCLHPKTRVLLGDLSWRELEDIQVGDELVAVDDRIVGFKKQRKMRLATVLGKVRTRRPALRITFTDGVEIVCSPDHKWLAQSTGGNGFKWRETRDLKPTYRISYLGEPWDVGRSWDSGYLSGLFDGEGYLCAPTAPNAAFKVCLSQKPGTVLDACVDTLTRCGFKATDPRPHAGGTMELTITGLHQCLRLLGGIKPRRLWARSRQLWEGKKFPSTTATIERIERIGYEDLIDIETSAGTFIAEGLVSHNCIATKRRQAKIVFDDARKLVRSSNLRNRIAIFTTNLHRDRYSQKLEPLGADADGTDGLNPHLIVTDEFHAMHQRDLIDVMESATGARRNPLHFQITTAGDDPVSPCGDQHDYACKILDGVLHDAATEAFFAFVAHADQEDDWLDETTWRKANPNYGLSVKPDDIRNLALKAKNMPSAAAEFKQKRLNLWVNSTQPWLSIEGWKAGQSEWDPNELKGERCFVGIDLASKLDLCAMSFVFPPVGTRKTWRLLQYIWTPEDTLRERAHRDRAPYPMWVDQKWLLTTSGTRVNHQAIRMVLTLERKRFAIQQIGLDPWHADTLIDQLTEEDGFKQEQVLEVSQTYAGMSSAAMTFEAAVLASEVDARQCPVTLWSASNAVVQRDGKDNIYPVKKKSRGRIDPIMSAIIGVSLAIRTGPPKKRGVDLFFMGGSNAPAPR